ncbi:MAG: ester cyclase [Polyangiaceae bacterium]|nr:ester cyclase [Polyangiaceae bacterium]
MATPHPLEAVIARYNDAWNRHDVEAIVALHTDDSVFENHTSGGLAVGKDAIRALITGVFSTFPDLHFETRRAHVRDDLVVQEWTATATHDRPVMRAGKPLPPSGRTLSWKGMDIIPMRGGLVARKDVYADSISYLRQLGVEIP